MNEKPEALLRHQHAVNITLTHMKFRIERLEAEIERLKAERDEAVKAEREACCKIVYGLCESDNVAQRTVNAIRARGEVPR